MKKDIFDIFSSPKDDQEALFRTWVSSIIKKIYDRFNRSGQKSLNCTDEQKMDNLVELLGLAILYKLSAIFNPEYQETISFNTMKSTDLSRSKSDSADGSPSISNSINEPNPELKLNSFLCPLKDNSAFGLILSEFLQNSPPSLTDKFLRAFDSFLKEYYAELPRFSEIILNNSFYSSFLSIYNKNRKKGRGIIYTPEPVVKFMVSAVNSLLRSKFTSQEGILDCKVHYMDPSVGSLAFPLGFFEIAFEKFQNGELNKDLQKKSFQTWVTTFFQSRENGEPNYWMFDIEMVPLLIGEFRFLTMMKAFGAKFSPDLLDAFRSGMYLQNALGIFEADSGVWFDTKNDAEPLVIITNPPYSVSSNNEFPSLSALLKEYTDKSGLEREPGKPKIKPIRGLSSTQDDYWKFIRLSQHLVEKRPGIVSLITNNFYIDGMAARGLRKSLRRTFDELWIMNLHGDWKKKDKNNNDASKDENIFDVNCGIAIMFAVRYPSPHHESHKQNNSWACSVKYYELKGSSQLKLAFLNNTTLENIPFQEVGDPLDWEFKPVENSTTEYQQFPYLCEIFVKTINGIKTGHDHELMDFDRKEVENKIKNLYEKYGTNPPNLPRISWNPIKILKADFSTSLTKIIEWNWRGFDKRWICYDPLLMQSHRYSIMQYMLPHQKNVCLIVNRQSRGKAIGKASSYFITTTIFDNMCNEGASGLHSHAFPLRLNLSEDPDDFNHPKPAIHSNLNQEFLKRLPYWNWSELTDQERRASEETLFYYIYAILYCPSYRNTYRDVLGREFPRIPLPNSIEPLESLSRLGKELAETHLLVEPITLNTNRFKTNKHIFNNEPIRIDRFDWIPEPTTIKDPKEELGTICFNARKTKGKKNIVDESSFCVYNIPKRVWEFEIGGILQLTQWLDSRRYDALGRDLTVNEVDEFLKIINAIEHTLVVQQKIDIEYQKMTHINYEKL